MYVKSAFGGAVLIGTALSAGQAMGAQPGFYLGGAIGQTTVKQDFGPIDFDETDDSWKVYGGMRFGLLGIEGGYVDLANASDSVLGTKAKVKLTGWDLFGTLNYDVGPVTLFGKAGGIAWDTDIKVGGVNLGDTGTDWAYGLGGAYNITRNVAVRAEVERFEVSDLDDVNTWTLGVDYTF